MSSNHTFTPGPHLVVFVRLLGRGREHAKSTLAVEHDQAATVLAGGVPLPPRSTDQHFAVEENRGFLISEWLHLMGLLVIESNRVVPLRVIPGDQLAVGPR
jgi:hypothetical protein